MGNRYEILEQLGGGGMAIVYKGRDTLLNRLVTIKVLRPEFTSDEDFVQRFRREAQAVARLSHPNIVSIYDVGWEEQIHYLVMEYVEGDNLKNLIRSQGTIPPGQAVEFALQISDALQHAHENDIVHRDVKPQNILITREGRAKLTDFGIAKEATTATLTQTDTVVGSVHYISPEQAKGETAEPASDIYSLGIVMYEMVTGKLPFQGETPIAVALKQIQDIPERPTSINPALPQRLENIILRAMAKKPVDRYENARQLSIELGGMIKNLPSVPSVQDDEFATRVIPAINGEDGVPPGVEPTPAKKSPAKGLPGWLWAVLIALALTAAGIIGFQLFMNVPEVLMPEVVGQSREDAERMLKEQGLNDIQVTLSSHPTIQSGMVIAQEPLAGTTIKANHRITLTVSKGPEIREVPDVVGLTINDARIKINQYELIVNEPLEEMYSEQYPKGVVVDQEPKPNARLVRGSGVTLYVSKGPQRVITVPALIGLTMSEAEAELDKLALQLDSNVTEVANTDYFEGQIIGQNPSQGATVSEGAVVQVTLSKGPGPVRRVARVEVNIDDDDEPHQLKIVVIDARGSNIAYVNTERPGKKVVKEIEYYGKAVVQVYIDNELTSEKEIG
jgi:serine/threonine protein kinase/beta-lactam-binding protein with PASTA domain